MLDFRISSINSVLRKVLIRLHYPLEVMLACVRWYVAYPLSSTAGPHVHDATAFLVHPTPENALFYSKVPCNVGDFGAWLFDQLHRFTLEFVREAPSRSSSLSPEHIMSLNVFGEPGEAQIASAAVDSFGALLVVAGAAAPLDIELHQALGHELGHLAQHVDVGSLLGELGQCDSSGRRPPSRPAVQPLECFAQLAYANGSSLSRRHSHPRLIATEPKKLQFEPVTELTPKGTDAYVKSEIEKWRKW